MQKRTHLVDEIQTTEPNYERTNNFIVGIALGITFAAGALIYVAGVVMNS